MINTHGTSSIEESKIEACVEALFDLTPAGIIKELNLLRPIYKKTASYGHFGRENMQFPWEETNRVEEIKEYLKI